jgi:hypothetical protein
VGDTRDHPGNVSTVLLEDRASSTATKAEAATVQEEERTFSPMRLTLLALFATFDFAHAGDWHMLPSSTARAVPQVHTANPEVAGVPQIINGIPTGDYPAVAALLIWNAEGEFLCSGTLVSSSVILTAAHCVANPPTAISAVFLPDGATATPYDVIAYAIHPEFRFPTADLAMLLLAAPVVGVAPVPLAERKPRPRAVGTIVGYGQDELGNVGLKERGTVRLARCPRRFPALGLPSRALARSVCWRARPGHLDTCHGDSGGPLLIGGDVAAVTSGGDPRCSGILSYDTSVVPFLPWIVSLLR